MHQYNDNQIEQKTLSEIFLENEALIKSVIYINISDRQQADDIFQDFFLSFITNPPKNHDNLKSYIRTRLTRDIIDRTRKNTRYKSLIDRYSKASYIKPTGHHRPDFKVIADEEQDKMLKLLSENLTESEAKAVMLRHLDGYSTTETSRIMDVKKRSASRYLAIGVKKLRKTLKPNTLKTEINLK